MGVKKMAVLPIDEVLPLLKEQLQEKDNVVLVAAPGAGKTTRVPLALLDEPWLAGRKIIMLEPRRIAARSAARYMAAQLGEEVGETIGYRIKQDTRVGQHTRVEVITEGVLTRMLQSDPELTGVGLVIFDEFHERNLHADLGLALCCESQSVLREDLKLLVMSATMDAEPIAAMLGDAPIVRSEGRAFPIETHYAERAIEGRLEPAIVRMITRALADDDGDLLVFLPGVGEIRRVEAQLKENRLELGRDIKIAPLYGNLSPLLQDEAIAPGVKGIRKIVLTTSIAETSLTVEGISVVIDSGLMRVPRFSPRTGMTRLETMVVSQASADQRRGRAGRLGPGVCYRLWTEQEHRQLPAHSTPEIKEADLAPLALELASWGNSDPTQLAWLDPPPSASYQQARSLLMELSALDGAGLITAHGKRVAELGMHPRLAHMILKAMPLGLGGLACELAAILSERDFMRGQRDAMDADVRHRVEAIRGMYTGHRLTVDESASRRIAVEAAQWKRELRLGKDKLDDVDACGLLLAFAYPDRIGQQRKLGHFMLRYGRGAALETIQSLSNADYLVVADVSDQGVESRIYLAAPVQEQELQEHLSDQITNEIMVSWDRSVQAVRGWKRWKLGAILLKEAPLSKLSSEEMLEGIFEGIEMEGLEILPWTRTARQLQQRLMFLHHYESEAGWPHVTDDALLTTVRDWLGPYLHGKKNRDDLGRLKLVDILESMLSWPQRRELDEHAPTHMVVPSGSRIPIDYEDSASPMMAVRLQELFGLRETPLLGKSRVPLTVHLLSPAQRPVQVTRDLASFWREAYFEVKKDLKGRYPKHYWPDDPNSAVPTNRAKPRGQ
jgi:ATP-dependent helicase HrpB